MKVFIVLTYVITLIFGFEIGWLYGDALLNSRYSVNEVKKEPYLVQPLPGETWALVEAKSVGPWPSVLCCEVKIIDVQQGFVRYTRGFSKPTDERSTVETFMAIHVKVKNVLRTPTR